MPAQHCLRGFEIVDEVFCVHEGFFSKIREILHNANEALWHLFFVIISCKEGKTNVSDSAILTIAPPAHPRG
jgi:hypothetical protein